jgi:hypothetical protein
MREQAERRIGHLYPKVRITPEMAARRPDLKEYEGRELTVIAWLWARTVRSPNPAAKGAMVPLVSSFVLSTKPGKEAWVEIVKDPGAPDGWRFEVRTRAAHGRPPAEARKGTKASRGANFVCCLTGSPIEPEQVSTEASSGEMESRLISIVAEGNWGRIYLDPVQEHEEIARNANPTWKPDIAMPENPRWFSPPLYGLTTFGDLFTDRQLVALNTFADLVSEARERVLQDARAAGMADDGVPLAAGGRGATAYADAVAVYLAFALDKLADRSSTICSWDSSPKMEALRNTFARQAIPMTWDFAEANPFSNSSANWISCIEWGAKSLDAAVPVTNAAISAADATAIEQIRDAVVSSDPPYYDNVGYADLSDFFYVWLRRTLRDRFPDLFATLQVPKQGELVATPYRHGGREEAEEFFLEGMSRALHNLATVARDDVPATIYYAFKQKEIEREGITSTGWATFLEAVIAAGFQIDGTWPIRTELSNRMLASGTNALANSIVLVCRRRPADAPLVSRREFLRALERELPRAVRTLQRSGISPVDLWQAAVGPGMAVFSRYAAVREADDRRMDVKTALSPTGARTGLPFAINAPFLQDPACLQVEEPARSPTNRWLLNRIGRLAAGATFAWLANPALTIGERAAACGLMPFPVSSEGTLAREVQAHVERAFAAKIRGRAVVLTAAGDLVEAREAIAFDPVLFDVWGEDGIAEALADRTVGVASPRVSDAHVERLVQRGPVERRSRRDLFDRLKRLRPPRPESFAGVYALWTCVLPELAQAWWRGAGEVALFPIRGDTRLQKASSCVRLRRSRALDERDAEFLLARWRRATGDGSTICRPSGATSGETFPGAARPADRAVPPRDRPRSPVVSRPSRRGRRRPDEAAVAGRWRAHRPYRGQARCERPRGVPLCDPGRGRAARRRGYPLRPLRAARRSAVGRGRPDTAAASRLRAGAVGGRCACLAALGHECEEPSPAVPAAGGRGPADVTGRVRARAAPPGSECAAEESLRVRHRSRRGSGFRTRAVGSSAASGGGPSGSVGARHRTPPDRDRPSGTAPVPAGSPARLHVHQAGRAGSIGTGGLDRPTA